MFQEESKQMKKRNYNFYILLIYFFIYTRLNIGCGHWNLHERVQFDDSYHQAHFEVWRKQFQTHF